MDNLSSSIVMPHELLRACAIAAVLGSLVGLACAKGPSRFAESGPETWNQEGHDYRLSSTRFESARRNESVYVMTYPVPGATAATYLTSDKIAQLALPLLRYAYGHHSFERGDGSPSRVAGLVVELVLPRDGRVLYRYDVPFSEAASRLHYPTSP